MTLFLLTCKYVLSKRHSFPHIFLLFWHQSISQECFNNTMNDDEMYNKWYHILAFLFLRNKPTSYFLGCRGIINLCENGDTYLIPISEKTFLENPRSHKYSCDDCIDMLSGSPILKHHLAWAVLESTGGSIAKIGARFWLAHSNNVLYQSWSFRLGLSWLSRALMIISTDPDGRSKNKHH